MQLLLKSLKIIVPSCFLLGASMELFMIKTGFYEIVTLKESERREERRQEELRQLKRIKELNIKVIDENYNQASIDK